MQANSATFGIYINCRRHPFIDEILVLAKTDETRNRNVFAGIIGKRVALIETGKGAPVVRGYATITGAEIIPFSNIAARKRAKIYGTGYDIKPGKTKVFYHLSDVKACKPYPLPEDRVNHGRSYTEF